MLSKGPEAIGFKASLAHLSTRKFSCHVYIVHINVCVYIELCFWYQVIVTNINPWNLIYYTTAFVVLRNQIHVVPETIRIKFVLMSLSTRLNVKSTTHLTILLILFGDLISAMVCDLRT